MFRFRGWLVLVLGGVAAAVVTAGGCAGDGAAIPDTPDASTAAPIDGATPPTTEADATADAAATSTVLASAGCETPGTLYPVGTTTVGTVAAGNVSRTFRVHVPPGYRPGAPVPVVLMIHGGGGSALQFETQSSEMDPIADREGFIAVYPDGTGLIKTFNAGICCGRAQSDDIDDVGFIGKLLDHLEGQLCTDRKRVFASGMSNGGLFSHRLACELSARIAAVAPVAGTIGVTTCTPSRPVPVLHIHGTDDGHVPFDGGQGCGPDSAVFTSVPATMEGWRTRNGCTTGTSPYFQQGDGTCTAFGDCEAPTVLCTIADGGHSWPGGAPKSDAGSDCPGDGPQSTTFSASEVAWKFFQANPMP